MKIWEFIDLGDMKYHKLKRIEYGQNILIQKLKNQDIETWGIINLRRKIQKFRDLYMKISK